MKGKTNCKQAGSPFGGEYVNIRLITNQSDHTPINGAVITVSYETYTEDFIWHGNELTLMIPAYIKYTISFGNVDGYKSPDSVSHTSVTDNARTIEVVYYTELITVNISNDIGQLPEYSANISVYQNVTIDGLTVLEYIESNGTQYIDTGLVVNSSTYKKYKFELDVEYYSASSNYWQVHGCSGSGLIYYFGLSDSRTVVYGDGVNNIVKTDVAELGRYQITFDAKNGIYKFGNLFEYTGLSFNTPSGSSNFYLFGYNKGGSCDAHSARVYSFKIYSDNILVHDYIPALRSDGIAGLYDKVNKTFISSCGTENFIAGPSFQKVEYIESTGTQYIDTGFKPKYNSHIVMDVEGVGTNTQWLFGTRDQNSTTAANQFSLYRESGTQLRSDYFGSTKTVSVSDISARSIVERNRNIVNAYGLSITNTAVSAGECPYPLYIFTLNMVGSVNTNMAVMKLYSCKIYDNDTLVRDYIPVFGSNGTAGLYDLLNNKFYKSESSDNFIAASNTKYTQTVQSQTHQIPHGYLYTVSVSEFENFLTPEPQTYFSEGQSRTINMIYIFD